MITVAYMCVNIGVKLLRLRKGSPCVKARSCKAAVTTGSRYYCTTSGGHSVITFIVFIMLSPVHWQLRGFFFWFPSKSAPPWAVPFYRPCRSLRARYNETHAGPSFHSQAKKRLESWNGSALTHLLISFFSPLLSPPHLPFLHYAEFLRASAAGSHVRLLRKKPINCSCPPFSSSSSPPTPPPPPPLLSLCHIN